MIKKDDEPLIFFLGAGASWDSGLPLGDNAARYIVKSVFNSIELCPLFERIEQYEKEKKVNLWPRFEVVIKVFEDYINNSAKSIVKTFFNCGISSTCLTLAQLKRPKIWMTTNFDNQIELALKKEKVKYKVITDRQELANLSINNYECDLIIKLHGDATEINALQNLGASIDQILREFPKTTIEKLIELVKNKKIFFIGYAARDPDLQVFISKMVDKVDELSWIDLGPCNERIIKLVGRKFKYFEQGATKSIETIFDLIAQEPVKFEERWEQKINKTVSYFEKSQLANIAADLCLSNNSAFSLSLIDEINYKLNRSKPFDQFQISRRQIHILFHTPDTSINDSIYYHISELEKLSLGNIDANLKNKINFFIANTLWRLDNPLESIKIINQILNDFNKNSAEYVDLLILFGIVKIYSGCEYFQDGIKQLEHAKKVAVALNFPIQTAEASLRLAIGLMRGSDPKRSEIELLSAKSTFYEIGNPRQLFIWQLNLAESYRNQRKFKDALLIIDNLIDQATLAEDREIITNVRANKGLILISMGKLLEGDKEFKEIVKITKRIEINQETKANAIYNRGWLRVICFLWEEAIYYLQLAAKSYKNDFYTPERRGATLSLIGSGHYFLGNIDRSKFILNKIHREKIIPVGNMSSDYKLLQFLNATTFFTNSRLEKAKEIFIEEPEQLFYIFFMLIKRNPTNSEYFKEGLDCAIKANLASFWGLLKLHALNHNLPLAVTTLKLINRNAPNHLNFLQKK